MKKDQSPRSFSSSEQYPDTGESGDVYDEEAIRARDESARRPEFEWFVDDFMRRHRFVLGRGRRLKALWKEYCVARLELGIGISLSL